jgi:ABC-type transport system involved in multi-copper enzyme maturation permease subunit
LKRIFSIAKNAFREAVRDRVLYSLILFLLLVIACAILLSDLTDGQEARTITNIGLNAMLLFGMFTSIFVGVGLVSKEIEKRTVFGIFSKPVHRYEFIVGKYLGLCLTLLVNVAMLGLGVSLALLYVGAATRAGTVWGGIFLIFVELTILTAVALVFSSFSTPALSALFTFFVFIIGHLSSSLRDLEQGLQSRTGQYFLEAVYWLMPNLAIYSFRTESANGMFPDSAMLIGGSLYAIAYVTILLIIAVAIFRRRNFK